MDDGSDSSLWQRLTRFFHNKSVDAVEQAIRDAGESGRLDEEEGSMMLSILSLDEMQVQDIMTPRTDIVCASDTDTIKQVAELSMESGHSRIPLYSGNRDNIIGVIYAKDLLRHLLNPEEHAFPAAKIMREPFFVPETKNVFDLLQEFRTRKLHIAVILDEYGGTAGLVSIEDVIEIIVGDIEDEHDMPRGEAVALQGDGSYLVAGRTELEDLAEALHVTLESEEVDTVGGYLTHLAGRVPAPGEEFTVDGIRFIVESADAKQIRSLRLFMPGPDGSPVSAGLGNPPNPDVAGSAWTAAERTAKGNGGTSAPLTMEARAPSTPTTVIDKGSGEQPSLPAPGVPIADPPA